MAVPTGADTHANQYTHHLRIGLQQWIPAVKNKTALFIDTQYLSLLNNIFYKSI